MQQELLKEWLNNEEINVLVDVEDLGSNLASHFIASYMSTVKDTIDFDDFRALIKLSVAFHNDEKYAWIKSKGATDIDLLMLKQRIDAYQKKIERLNLGEHLAWRLNFTSSVSNRALLALNMNKNSIIHDESLPSFLTSVDHIVRTLLNQSLSKIQARQLVLDANLQFPPYINSNTLANILFVLHPQAFPLTNNYIRSQFKNILGLKVTNTPAGYIELAESLDALAQQSELPKDYSMAVFDRFLADYERQAREDSENSQAEAAEETIDEEAIAQVSTIGSLNTILFGAPGTGKTYRTRRLAVKLADPVWYGNHEDDEQAIKAYYAALTQSEQARIQFTTFHQSFVYEDFIEGFKAQTTEDGSIHYAVEDGVFKNMALSAIENPELNYVLIIDEINRGNISRIFGELITLLEDDKRLGRDNELSTTLPYSKKIFTVPQNLYIIGTMNTADKSLAQLDLALRRRFDFVEMMPDTELLGDIKIFGESVAHLLDTINKRIQALLDREHVIGHAYFMSLLGKTDADERNALAQQIIKNKIIPLLQEYFFDDWESIMRVLGKHSPMLIRKKESFEDLGVKPLYQLNIDALGEQAFYEGIKSRYEGN